VEEFPRIKKGIKEETYRKAMKIGKERTKKRERREEGKKEI
jgi:hypothetical protein